MITAIIPSRNEQAADKVWVWLSVDKNGNEGICFGPVPGMGHLPLVCMHERIKPHMDEAARQVGALTKTTIRRVCFTRAEAEEIFLP